MKKILSLAVICLMAAPVSAVTLDGSTAGDGYALRTVQTVETQFGDNLSELDAGYALIDGGALNIVLTGQVESNFNKLNIFIATGGAGGQQTIGPATDEGGLNPNNDDWAENYSGVGPSASGNGPGFTFDNGFAANYLIIARNGNAGGDRFDFDFSSVGNAGTVEASLDIFGGSLTGSNASVGASGIGVGYDNSNAAGILGGTAAADQVAAAAVTTGLELVIPLAAIGNPNPADIKVSAHINGSNHDFLSNQSLGGFAPPQSNLGGDGGGNFNNDVSLIDLRQFPLDQHFAAIPEPASFALAGMAVIGMFCTRRRS